MHFSAGNTQKDFGQEELKQKIERDDCTLAGSIKSHSLEKAEWDKSNWMMSEKEKKKKV